MQKLGYLAGAVAALALLPLTAGATVLDLTTASASGTINSAIFTQGTVGSGTGVYPAFVQITSPGGQGTTSSAYNTTANNVLNNGSSPTFNHAIQLGNIPVITIAGVQYYSFRLDVNESSGGTPSEAFISLDQLQFYTSTTPNQSTTNVSTLGTLRYNLDAGTDSTILLDYSLESGSGTDDMEALIPIANFATAKGSDYVYLFSSYGALGVQAGSPEIPAGNYGVSDGFEEWARGRGITPVCTGADCPSPDPQCAPGVPCYVPEPGSLTLLGSMLAIVGGVFWWQRRRTTAVARATA